MNILNNNVIMINKKHKTPVARVYSPEFGNNTSPVKPQQAALLSQTFHMIIKSNSLTHRSVPKLTVWHKTGSRQKMPPRANILCEAGVKATDDCKHMTTSSQSRTAASSTIWHKLVM